MSTKEREPLLSDEELDKWEDQRRGGKGGITFKWTAPKVRDFYEQARQQDIALIQRLVDALSLPIVSIEAKAEHMQQAQDALFAAAERGITPTKP